MKAAGLAMACAAAALAAAGVYMALNMDSSHAGEPRSIPPAQPVPDEPRVDPVIDVPDERSAQAAPDVVAGNNAFALEMYRQLTAGEQGNVFFSPYSIESVLAMAAEGAAGATQQEMLAAGRLPADAGLRRSQFQALHAGLNQPSAQYQLSAANALWVQNAYPLKSSYTGIVRSFYSGGATNLDFAKDAERSRQTINKWVEDRTQERIKDLFGPGSLTAQTRLVLTNAIYFKGKWQYEFDPESTYDAAFHAAPEQDVQAKFMALRGYKKPLPYAKSADWEAVSLPYKGDDLSMLVILPGAGQSLAGLEGRLTLAELDKLRQTLANEEVVVQLPKWKFDTKYTLNDYLKGLGMQAAFTPDADFAGMADTHELFVDLVIHQAFVAVDEAGTEAAAATGMAMAGSAAPMKPPTVFRADRPFLFAIQDTRNGALLFLGRVVDPTK